MELLMIFNLNSFQIWFKMASENSLLLQHRRGPESDTNRAQAVDSQTLLSELLQIEPRKGYQDLKTWQPQFAPIPWSQQWDFFQLLQQNPPPMSINKSAKHLEQGGSASAHSEPRVSLGFVLWLWSTTEAHQCWGRMKDTRTSGMASVTAFPGCSSHRHIAELGFWESLHFKIKPTHSPVPTDCPF